jgi:methylenetetrahydrofolate reductase (NADPH)
MKYIRDIHEQRRAEGRPAISFEFFPAKTPEGEQTLLTQTVPALLAGRPDYCSVTYGAGGGTREITLGIVDKLQREHGLTTMMHLTCVNHTRAEIASVVAEARACGVRNILALRGDPPPGEEWKRTEGGFEFSRELVEFLRAEGGFSIGTAGFPEGHIAQAAGKHVDWGFLGEKVQAGADFIITQLFFDNTDFYEFRDYLTGKLGVTVPIIPGILPVLTQNQTKRFVTMCGARLPAPFLARIDELGADDAAVTAYGIDYATAQCADLLQNGVPGLHFYTLNKSHSTLRVLEGLGLKQP